ncbi:hypothetical protein [Natronorubrum halophilum]|uniref:hypothetical protein n=1 Tax=Natronorubrum halophilum TaxID=1702106 RepID=UPI000EF6CFC7|nr:hypothetical protein [Natronorubrum halophilum]
MAVGGSVSIVLSGCLSIPENSINGDNATENGTTLPPDGQPDPEALPHPEEDPDAPNADPEVLAKYTSSQFAYSTLYPEAWSIDESDPTTVAFLPADEVGGQKLYTFSNEESLSVEEFAERWLTTASDTAATYDVVESRYVTIPSGQTGIIYDIDSTYESGEFRQKVLVVTASVAQYVNEFWLSADVYTEKVDQFVDLISESLTLLSAETG